MAAGGATSPPKYIDLAVPLLYSELVSDKCARRNSWTLRESKGYAGSRIEIEHHHVWMLEIVDRGIPRM